MVVDAVIMLIMCEGMEVSRTEIRGLKCVCVRESADGAGISQCICI